MDGCDVVAHLAAAADVDRVAGDPVAAEELNARGTLNVLEAARGAGLRRVIYASTIWVYSSQAADPWLEDAALPLPGHLYTATKLAGEMYCRAYGELFGQEYTVLRFGIPFGPRARAEGVIPTFVSRALAGEPLTLAGGGEQSRRFVYVEDLAEGVVCALRPVAANRTYNLVGSEDVRIRDIAGAVKEIVGDVELEESPGRRGDFGGAVVSGERAHEELGWRPRTSFQEGMRRYVAWHVEAQRELDARERMGAAPALRTGERARRLGWALLFAGLATIMAAALVLATVVPWPHAVAHAARTHEALLGLGALVASIVARVAAVRNRSTPPEEGVSRSQA
jgi:UDP-glucose 4-epimerase